MWGDGVGKFGSNRQRQVSNEASILILSRYEVTYSRISPPYCSDAIRRDFALHSETSTLFLAIIFFHFSVCIPPSSSSPYVPIVHSPSIPQVPILLPHAKTGNRRRADASHHPNTLRCPRLTTDALLSSCRPTSDLSPCTSPLPVSAQTLYFVLRLTVQRHMVHMRMS
jgi:hypothetical protein